MNKCAESEPKTSRSNKTVFGLLCILALFIPGSAWLLTHEKYKAILTPFLALCLFSLCAWSRIISEPWGFALSLTLLIGTHLVSYAMAIRKAIHQLTMSIIKESKIKLATLLTLLVWVNAGLLVTCHLNKAIWFGFDLYHVPSQSMQPTINKGDYVIADTWLLNIDLANIVIIQNTEGQLFIKRVAAVGPTIYHWKDHYNHENDYTLNNEEMFVESDNQKYYTLDSRQKGAFLIKNIQGVATFKLQLTPTVELKSLN